MKDNRTFPIFGIILLISLCVFLFVQCGKKSEPQEVPAEYGTVTDRQRNVYGTVKIGDQWWMTENLRVKVFNDSTPVSEVLSADIDSSWSKAKGPAFCDMDKRYGLHYNWYVVSGNKQIAPAGWHVPTDEDWKILEKFLGMENDAVENTGWRGTNEGEQLITKASKGWPTTSVPFGSDRTGFSALPGGCKTFNGTPGEVAFAGYWWCNSTMGSREGWYRNISASSKTIFRYHTDKRYGMSIRCVKN